MAKEEGNLPAPEARPSASIKIVTILAGIAVVISLVNTALLLLNPTAGKVEQFNESLKTDVAESIASVHKKVDSLKSAEQEWQAVLKKASEKPDAVYKLVNSQNGLLTLTEIAPPAASPAAPVAEEEKK
jgi:sensor histidine kinase regulating citrate/malate metabolism